MAKDRQEKPILFDSWGVRQILAGKKTETRRLVQPQPDPSIYWEPYDLSCPFGKVGDRLWVRETWNLAREQGDGEEKWLEPWNHSIPKEYPRNRWLIFFRATDGGEGPWRPSIHMPRWASRISLEILEISVQRLRDITEGDAEREGEDTKSFPVSSVDASPGYALAHPGGTLISSFAAMWNRIYAPPRFSKSRNRYESYPWSTDDLLTSKYRSRILWSRGSFKTCPLPGHSIMVQSSAGGTDRPEWYVIRPGHPDVAPFVIYPNPWVWVIRFQITSGE